MEAIVCIPIYKTELNIFEEISLKQVNKILKKHKKVFIAPENLRFDYRIEGIDCEVERFPDKYFKDTKGYSELCLSLEFYERFSNYKYMLIYQLDAFVFSDQLSEWCNKGYDYIGAPGIFEIFDAMCAWVGNGGLSLRKISKAISILKNQEDVLNNHPLHELFHSNEDVFWAYCGGNKNIEFTVPDVFEAQKFSAQYAINNILYEMELPFGTHYYNTVSYNIWYPIIKSYGYQVPDVKEVKFFDSFGEESERWYVFYTLYKKVLEKQNDILAVGKKETYSVLGAGKIGKECLHLLQMIGANISYVFDNNLIALNGIDDFSSYIIKKPKEVGELLENEILLIAIKEIDNEIQKIIQYAKDKGNVVLYYDEFFGKLKESYL